VRISLSPAPILLAVTVAAISCTGSTLAAGPTLMARTFVLKSSDVSPAFSSKSNFIRPLSLADAMSRYRVTVATLKRKGLVGGYESSFTRPFNPSHTPKGPYGVVDDVTQFSSPSGAHWLYQRLKKSSDLTKPVSVPAFGDERVAVDTGVLKGSRSASITFRHGDFVVTVSTSSVGTSDPLPNAVHYARIIDHRLTAHSQ
jgi:hypothetical protein